MQQGEVLGGELDPAFVVVEKVVVLVVEEVVLAVEFVGCFVGGLVLF